MTDITRHLISTQYGQIHCRTAGTGRAIVLLHINQQSSALYLELIAHLAPHLQAVAIDYPSHGMSDHIDFQPTLSDYAKCVDEAMQGLCIKRYCVLGEATGATVAVEMGIHHLDRVNGIILLNCPYYRDSKQSHGIHSKVQATDLRPVDPSGFPLTRTIDFVKEKDPAHLPLAPTQSWMDRVNLAQIEAGRDSGQALAAVKAYELADNFSKVGCETLLLMGEHFQYTVQLDEYKQRFQHLTAEVIPHARFCMGWEKAEVIAPKILAFVSRLSYL